MTYNQICVSVRHPQRDSTQKISVKGTVPSCLPPSWPTSLHVWESRPQRGAPGGGSSPPASVGSWWRRSRESLSCPRPTWPVLLDCGPMGSVHIWGCPPFCQSVGCWWRRCRRTRATAAVRRVRGVASYFSLPEGCRQEVKSTRISVTSEMTWDSSVKFGFIAERCKYKFLPSCTGQWVWSRRVDMRGSRTSSKDWDQWD